MSKHKSRKSRWTEVSPLQHVTSCGKVTANKRGKWDAIIRYQERHPKYGFFARDITIGEFKRAREAMMAVEERAMAVAKNPNVIISWLGK